MAVLYFPRQVPELLFLQREVRGKQWGGECYLKTSCEEESGRRNVSKQTRNVKTLHPLSAACIEKETINGPGNVINYHSLSQIKRIQTTLAFILWGLSPRYQHRKSHSLAGNFSVITKRNFSLHYQGINLFFSYSKWKRIGKFESYTWIQNLIYRKSKNLDMILLVLVGRARSNNLHFQNRSEALFSSFLVEIYFQIYIFSCFCPENNLQFISFEFRV